MFARSACRWALPSWTWVRWSPSAALQTHTARAARAWMSWCALLRLPCAVPQHGCCTMVCGAALHGRPDLICSRLQNHAAEPLLRRSTMLAPTIARRATLRRAWGRCARSAVCCRGTAHGVPWVPAASRACVPALLLQLALLTINHSPLLPQVNYLGPYALTRELEETLQRSAPARVGWGCATVYFLAIWPALPRVNRAVLHVDSATPLTPPCWRPATLLTLPCCVPPPGGQCELCDTSLRLDRRPDHVPVLLAARQLLPQVNSRRHMGQHSQSCPAWHSCTSCTRNDSVGCRAAMSACTAAATSAHTLCSPCRFQHQARQRAVRV